MAGPSGDRLREETLLPGYLFFGEEDFLAEEFIEELEALLASSIGGEFHLTRMDLDETKWRDIVDTARTAPFLFEPWRAIVVRIPERKAGPDKKSGADGGRRARGPSSCPSSTRRSSGSISPRLRPGRSSPSSGPARVRRDDAAVRFFQSLPKTALSLLEMKSSSPCRTDAPGRREGPSSRQNADRRARKRLFDLLGQDLRLMMNEVAKLAVFVGDKKGIEEGDVDQATAGQRSFQPYDLDDALAAADFAKGAAILNELLAEGERSGGDRRPPGRLLPQRARRSDPAEGEEPDQGRDLPGRSSLHFQRLGTSIGGNTRTSSASSKDSRPAELNALLMKLPSARPTIKTTSLQGRGREDPVRSVLEGNTAWPERRGRLFRRWGIEEPDLPAEPGFVAASGVLLDGALLDRRVDGLEEPPGAF